MELEKKLESVRILVFLIKKGCNYCNLFKQSEEYQSLFQLERYLDNNVKSKVIIKYVNPYGLSEPRYNSIQVKLSGYKLPGRKFDVETKNFLLAKGFKITHFPAIVLQMKYQNKKIQNKVIQGIKIASFNKSSVNFNFMDYILKYINHEPIEMDEIDAFKHKKYKYIIQKKPNLKLIKINQ
ncbi:MAG: hypothetical protein ACP6IY_08000 [Promethearchaeia archaeon]